MVAPCARAGWNGATRLAGQGTAWRGESANDGEMTPGLQGASKQKLPMIDLSREQSWFANYPQLAYSLCMKATFIELPPFARYRQVYLDDDAFRSLQQLLLGQPDAGDVIQGTGGLRKVRFADAKRGKGKRGGLRVIYYWWLGGDQFWLFTLYDKDEASDLSSDERKALKAMLEKEIEVRSQS